MRNRATVQITFTPEATLEPDRDTNSLMWISNRTDNAKSSENTQVTLY